MSTGSHYKPSDTEKNNYISKDASTGVITIKPRGLKIVWGNDERYWKIDKTKNDSAAELVQVCWLEVTGEIPVEAQYLEAKNYKLIFNVELKPDAFGWKESPVHFMVKPNTRGRRWKRCFLGSLQKNTNNPEPFQAPGDDKDTCLKFQVPEDAKTVSFGMFEIWKGTWKGGLKIINVQVKPV